MHTTWIEMDCDLILFSKYHCVEVVAENTAYTCDSFLFPLMVLLLNPLYPCRTVIAEATKALK